MKRRGRNILAAVFTAALLGLLTFTASLGRQRSETMPCRRVEVILPDSLSGSFLLRSDILTWLKQDFGPCQGKPLGSLPLHRIEHRMESHTAVLRCQAWVCGDSTLYLQVRQRQPLLRLQRAEGPFYVDGEAYLFPARHRFTPRVPVLDGAIPLHVGPDFRGIPADPAQQAWLQQALALTRRIRSDKRWSELLQQISIAPNGDFTLINCQDGLRFIIGDVQDLEGKMRKLEKYYTHIAPLAETEGKTYHTINLKYSDRIICR